MTAAARINDAAPTHKTWTVVLASTLGLAAAAWVVAVRQMNEMDMGVATELGSFASGLGVLIVIAPWSVPGLTPPM